MKKTKMMLKKTALKLKSRRLKRLERKVENAMIVIKVKKLRLISSTSSMKNLPKPSSSRKTN